MTKEISNTVNYSVDILHTGETTVGVIEEKIRNLVESKPTEDKEKVLTPAVLNQILEGTDATLVAIIKAECLFIDEKVILDQGPEVLVEMIKKMTEEYNDSLVAFFLNKVKAKFDELSGGKSTALVTKVSTTVH